MTRARRAALARPAFFRLWGDMEIAADAGPRPHVFKTIWLWGPMLCVALATVLTDYLPPGLDQDATRNAAAGLRSGELARGGLGLATLAYAAAWMLAKPLFVIGAIQWLEFHVSGERNPRNYLLAWAAQGLTLGLPLSLVTMLSVLHMLPQPLISVGPAENPAALYLVSVPLFFASLLIVDFLGYWTHRAMHRFAFLWRFHALHHSLDVDVLHNLSHPVDVLLLVLFVTVPAAFLIGVSQEQLYLLVAFTSLQGHLNHTRLPINLGPLGGTLLCDNRYHFLHHSFDPAHHDRNFASRFPVLDMLFGTYAGAGRELAPTGLADRAAPRTLGQYLTARLPERPAPNMAG
jgi:sterol desaturase/sphingolipid hydroxylase (fatty acid hydroxylase superfamily)